jgi:hypothetical protein
MSKVFIIPTAVWLALAGVAFTVRCEISPSLPGGWPTCWVIGGSVAGVQFFKRLAEKAGFVDGYNTYNPALRRKEEESNPNQDITPTNPIL